MACINMHMKFLKLKFQSKIDLCSGNHVVYRQKDGRTDARTDGRTDKVNPVYPLQLRWGGGGEGCLNITKIECHWWRRNDDHDRRPLSLPLRCDRATLCSYEDLGQIKGVFEILKLRKRVRIWQTSFVHGINSSHLICFRGYGNLSTLCIALPRLAFGRAWYSDAACG